MNMGKKDQDKLFDRESAQGSVYDKMYFTDDQLKQGAEINQKAAAGEITWDSAHNWWENTRAGYGYTGGENGHGYNVLAKNTVEPTTEAFSYGNAPSYANKYAAPINELLGSVLNRDAFTYDPANDPLYQQYEDSYTRMGQQAMEDTLAQVSARTGGLASSYAGTAAQQTYNGYMSALADKVPELRQLAYQMYMDEGNSQRQNLELLQNLEQIAYGRYLNDLDQHNADRNFAYGAHRDQIADQQYAGEWAYKAGRDRISDNRYNQEYSDNKAATDKADARARISAYLAANGSVADLDGVLISASGYTDAELTALEKYYADQRAKEETAAKKPGGKNPANPTATDYDGLFAAAHASGYPKSYIANNYKNFGFTSSTGLYDEFIEWDGGTDPEPEPLPPAGKPAHGYGPSYSTAWGQARKMFDNGKSEDEIMVYLDTFTEDRLTDDGLSYIMNSLNLGGYRG